MKTLSIFVLLLLLSVTAFAQNCDECSRPRVALYDCDVQVPRPTEANAIIAWWNLFWPSAVARSTMYNSDSSKDCIVWLDGALINASALQGDVLKFGQEYANLPSSGPINSCDYLIRSAVTGTEGSYVFTLILEAGPSREVVKSVTMPFAATIESSDKAGRQAASQIMPLFQTIRKFEINKRNNDVTVAIRDLEKESTLIIRPEKQQVDEGETIDVDVTLTDCDGVPLRNRSIIFKDTTIHFKDNDAEIQLPGSTGGEIIPKVAVTNGSGKVKVQFKAGDAAGVGTIVGYYPYYKPCGKNGIMDGTAKISVVKPVDYLNATLKVNAYAKKSWKGYDKIDRVEESKFEYETKMVLFICRDCVETLIASPDRNNARYDGYNVVSGGSFYQKWDYEKSSDPVAEFRVPVSVKQDSRTEGFRSSGENDWGPLYTETVSHQVTTQAVLIYISPLIDKKVTSGGTTQTPKYVFKMRAPTIITELGKISQTNDGKAQRWDASFNKMEDMPPPFNCHVPFVEDPFFDGNDEQSNVSPPVIDAKELETYLLNPVGEKILNLHGTAFRPDNSNDYELTMDINIVLSPRNE